MSSDWHSQRLGDLIDIRGGLAYKSEEIDKGNARLLGMGCVSFDKRFLDGGCRRYSGEYKPQHLISPGELVIATRQQSDNLPILGFPAMVPDYLHPESTIVGTNLYKVENHSPYSNSYLYWLMRGDEYRDHIKARATGSTVRMITKDVVLDFCFKCPPPQEGKSIADFLDSFDDKIELNRKTNETLEAIAKALFKSWFVDFDPVRAKAEVRPTGLPAEISNLFPDSFEESELGEIPRGWEVVKLIDVADINYGQNLPQPKLMEHGIPVFGAAGVIGYYSEAMFAEPIVLVTSRGSGSGTVHETHGPAFVTNNSFSVTPKAGWFSRHYIRESLLNGDIVSLVTGSAQPQLTITNFSHLEIIQPAERVVTSFHEITESLWKKKLTDQEETCTLAALRDTLLPKLISGELRVPDAEALVAEAGL